MSDALTERYPRYSAADFRRRALNQSGGPIDHSWRDHGDHILNPDIVAIVETLQLRDAAVLVPVVDDGDEARVIFTKRTANAAQAFRADLLSGRGDRSGPTFRRKGCDPRDGGGDRRSPALSSRRSGACRIILPRPGFRITPVLAVVKPGYEF